MSDYSDPDEQRPHSSAARRRFQFSLLELAEIVALIGSAIALLNFSFANTWFEWPQWLIEIAFVLGATCAGGAMGIPWNRGRQVATIGAIVSLSLAVWIRAEMYILHDMDESWIRFFYPASRAMRFVLASFRLVSVLLLITATFALGRRCWRALLHRPGKAEKV